MRRDSKDRNFHFQQIYEWISSTIISQSIVNRCSEIKLLAQEERGERREGGKRGEGRILARAESQWWKERGNFSVLTKLMTALYSCFGWQKVNSFGNEFRKLFFTWLRVPPAWNRISTASNKLIQIPFTDCLTTNCTRLCIRQTTTM